MNLDLKKLPSPPGVAVKLLELFAAPDVTLDDMTNVISVDPALTSRIINYSNSPIFARRHEAGSLNQAVTMLGTNGVKLIALSFSLTEVKSPDSSGSFDFNQFWGSSLATAVCAKKIYAVSGKDADTGFLVGLLLNIGQLAMYCSSPDQYESIKGNKAVFDLGLLSLEKDVFSENRYIVGSEVLTAWNFPKLTVDALKGYGNEDGEKSEESTGLDLASRMSYTILSDEPDYDIVSGITADLAKLVGTDVENTEDLFGDTLQEYADVASILSYEIPENKSLKEIELEAKTKIVEMTMDLHTSNAQVQAENNELKDMAYIDSLTQLGNRRQYESTAGSELSRCARLGNSFGMMVVDIDHFKKVNDTYGHAAGDEILVNVAKRLQSCLRKYDSVFRFGGEEFVVVLPEATAETCATVAERLRLSIEETSFQFETQEIPVTISIGGDVYGSGTPADLNTLFQNADQALYDAKKSGRNQYKTFQKDRAAIPAPAIAVNPDVVPVAAAAPNVAQP